MNGSRQGVEGRGEQFASGVPTALWLEQPTPHNPYLAERCYCQGYDLLALMAGRSFVEVLYLLFRGELPSPAQATLLERLMIACINPGPRHGATRAAMNAGIGRTQRSHLLPIALTVLGGDHLGGGEVEAAMQQLSARKGEAPSEVITTLPLADPSAGDHHPLPGFGSRYGGIDPLPGAIAQQLAALPAAGPHLAWGEALAQQLAPHNMGWLLPGVVAATLADLGFEARQGAGLFQLLAAPGLLAHGLEVARQPITAMPFPDAEHYVIERE